MRSPEEYEALVAKMDHAGLGVICNMDGEYDTKFDKNMQVMRDLYAVLTECLVRSPTRFADALQDPWYSCRFQEVCRAIVSAAVDLAAECRSPRLPPSAHQQYNFFSSLFVEMPRPSSIGEVVCR